MSRKLFISRDYITYVTNYISHELLLYRKNNPTKMSFVALHSDRHINQLKQIKTIFLKDVEYYSRPFPELS